MMEIRISDLKKSGDPEKDTSLYSEEQKKSGDNYYAPWDI